MRLEEDGHGTVRLHTHDEVLIEIAERKRRDMPPSSCAASCARLRLERGPAADVGRDHRAVLQQEGLTMTEEQIERLLALLDEIETSMGVLADCTENISDMLRGAMEIDDEGDGTLRVVDVHERHEK